jgi:hypothetical protein
MSEIKLLDEEYCGEIPERAPDWTISTGYGPEHATALSGYYIEEDGVEKTIVVGSGEAQNAMPWTLEGHVTAADAAGEYQESMDLDDSDLEDPDMGLDP